MDDSNINRYLMKGKNDINWYADCQTVFEELFGKDKLQLVCKLFAATSINTSLKSNITLFRKAYYEIENNLPIGDYLPNIQKQLFQIRCGDELTGRKIRSFASAMSGDINAVVVDVWLLRAFEMDKRYMRHTGPNKGLERSGGATDKQYTQIETYCRDLATFLEIEPRQVSSMIWAGVRIEQTGDYNTHYKELLRNSFINLFNVI